MSEDRYESRPKRGNPGFRKGVSGNPAGRPIGIKNKAKPPTEWQRELGWRLDAELDRIKELETELADHMQKRDRLAFDLWRNGIPMQSVAIWLGFLSARSIQRIFILRGWLEGVVAK